MTKRNTKSATQKYRKQKDLTNFFELLKTQGLTDEFYDIYDPAIYGENIMEIRFSLENKWTIPKKDESYSKYNASVGTITYKPAT